MECLPNAPNTKNPTFQTSRSECVVTRVEERAGSEGSHCKVEALKLGTGKEVESTAWMQKKRGVRVVVRQTGTDVEAM